MQTYTEKQIAIIQIAEKLFAENGFDGTSIRDISKVAQVNIAMISYYFGSKEKLLEDIIFYRTGTLKLQIENLFKEDLTPIDKIEKLIEIYISMLHQNKCIFQIMNFEISNKKRIVDTQAFIAVKKKNFETIKKIIEEGQNKNLFKKDINIHLIGPTILGTYFHFYNNQPFFKELLEFQTEKDLELYISNELTKHIKQTIKSLLLHEK